MTGLDITRKLFQNGFYDSEFAQDQGSQYLTL